MTGVISPAENSDERGGVEDGDALGVLGNGTGIRLPSAGGTVGEAGITCDPLGFESIVAPVVD